MKRRRDYSDKIMYWQNRLNESVTGPVTDLKSSNIEKALKSLTYFTQKQIEIVKKNEDDNFQEHYNAITKFF